MSEVKIDFNEMLNDIDKKTLEGIRVKELKEEKMETSAIDMGTPSMAQRLEMFCKVELNVLVKRSDSVIYLDKVTEEDMEAIEKQIVVIERSYSLDNSIAKINRKISSGISTGAGVIVPATKVTANMVGATAKGLAFASVKSASVLTNSLKDSYKESVQKIVTDDEIQEAWTSIKSIFGKKKEKGEFKYAKIQQNK